ncbi:alpha/beta hydrolase [Frankia sp. AgB1.9]|uniref:alpha/beta hydrolase n=1 Tax=unclassified Frankia TaxID=2632575 RepID=UPI0019348A2F|nr:MULTISPECIES: alpha/beta hydrolase [unclassified Frankia]MBL7488498.1 alpha/beta hydrolase [Frankia sp. AgW1.1]MBL7547281.1 alpha/beta hydrolase [Frankia sp. AgB1.9]MBL7620814.1 alpha/beta hydrolase [Frankia sp. AgB1.8]
MTSAHPPTRIPERLVPVPTTLSEPAQAIISMGNPLPFKPWPPLDDREAVQAFIDERNAAAPPGAEGPMVASCYGAADTGVPCATARIELDGVGVWQAIPDSLAADDRRVYLVIHGAWIYGGGELARLGAAMTAGGLGAKTWAVDYRMPPFHPFPTPLDDCLTAYRALLEAHRPEDIIIGGMSGGANLTVATILRARDEGLPLPAAAVVNTPPIDLTKVGDSYQASQGVDISYDEGELETVFQLYTNGHDRRDPYVSPLFGDFGKGFPPTILTTGTRDFLLSDTVRLHRTLLTAGVEAELHVWEGAPHFMFLGLAPEDHQRQAQVRVFCERQWADAR